MTKHSFSNVLIILLCAQLLFLLSTIDAQSCKPSGKLRGKKPPRGQCNTGNDSECCEEGKFYTTFKCSPTVTGRTKATLTLNGFGPGADGGGPSECDGKFHNDSTPVVAMSTGWFNKSKRCFHKITIYGNGRRVKAMVVDECDSSVGCDSEHDFQPPCRNDIVDGSRAVWEALGVPKNKRGLMNVFWSDP